MFQDKLSFNSSLYNLWEIYETIKTYYPIGIPQREGGGIFFEYSGIKKLEEIIINAVHNETNYKKRWTDYTDTLEKDLKKKVLGTTYGQAPSFCASVIVENKVVGKYTHLKQLQFSVSLIGNFFSIYGLDSTRFLDDEDSQENYHVGNVVTTSPYKEFKEDFKILEHSIRKGFPNHKLVPYAFGQQIIDGLQVRYSNAKVCSVHMALFNDFIQPRNNFKGHIINHTRGNGYYGLDDWTIIK